MGEKLTVKQKRVYDFVKKQIRDSGFPPSVREICDAVGLSSTSSVHAHLQSLEDKGYIRRSKSKNRSIEILENDFYYSAVEYRNLPIIGRITPGQPETRAENIEGYFPIPIDYIGNHEAYMLRVKDDSMIGKGINGNDLVLVKKANTAVNGEIVVALASGAETVKTFFMERSQIRLQPENPLYQPIVSREVEILGVVIGLFRKF